MLAGIDVDSAGILSQMERLRPVNDTFFEGWRVRTYFGQRLGTDQALGYTAVAVAAEHEKALSPRQNTLGVDLTIGSRRVLVVAAGSASRVTRELKSIFQGFTWKTTQTRSAPL